MSQKRPWRPQEGLRMAAALALLYRPEKPAKQRCKRKKRKVARK